MDFHSLSRRELQALCKSNGIRANMSNAAMAEALRCLPAVDRIDEIGSTAPPPVSAMKEQTPDAEEAVGGEQEHGCPLPRGGRARGKRRKAGARKSKTEGDEEEVMVPGPQTLPGPKMTVAREAAAAPVDDAEEAAVGIRTRRSARSKVKVALDQKEEDVQAAAARKEQKVSDKSCEDSEEHAIVVGVVEEEEVRKPQEGQNVTRRAAPYKTHEDLQPDQRTAEELSMAKKRTRRSTRSKVAAAAQKGQKADSSDTTVGPEIDPKYDEVVPKVEEATKPQEGKNVTKRATAYIYKAHEEVQTGQVTAAPEATAEEVATTKRRRRRSTRSKVGAAARKAQKECAADTSDAVNGSTVSDDPKEEQVVEVIEEGTTKHNEEREQINNVRQFASLPKLEDSPILGIVSKPNTADASDKAPVAHQEASKEDRFTFTGEADVSNLLVNTLDRFAKPVYESRVKEEKKCSECWWMLL
ncbi:uncharacterized protein [Zea mays]|uniref:uncharacterized protein isoform X2 n=1 Tax=Zea mays TaxID=4577 RepID=UPI0004DEBD8C|nr:uncharacterized protein LOC100277817 isoform X2 [Zea mays]|eukprot:XP_008671669.1 uncharacterized protein LOC100277817 isoform X2 [Zea mays]